jgi:hypothetical protein
MIMLPRAGRAGCCMAPAWPPACEPSSATARQCRIEWWNAERLQLAVAGIRNAQCLGRGTKLRSANSRGGAGRPCGSRFRMER